MANEAFMAGWNAVGQNDKKQKSTAQKSVKGMQSILKTTGQNKPDIQTTQQEQPALPMKRGGHIVKGGLAMLHRGETVVPAKRRSRKAAQKRTAIKW